MAHGLAHFKCEPQRPPVRRLVSRHQRAAPAAVEDLSSSRGRVMSSKGIYSAVSGAMAQSSRLDTIANNLANVNTSAFKKDRQVFSEYLSTFEKPDDLIRVPRVPASIESFMICKARQRLRQSRGHVHKL